eukprot:353839-Chlamydomonas_euryale.AAC.28
MCAQEAGLAKANESSRKFEEQKAAVDARFAQQQAGNIDGGDANGNKAADNRAPETEQVAPRTGSAVMPPQPAPPHGQKSMAAHITTSSPPAAAPAGMGFAPQWAGSQSMPGHSPPYHTAVHGSSITSGGSASWGEPITGALPSNSMMSSGSMPSISDFAASLPPGMPMPPPDVLARMVADGLFPPAMMSGAMSPHAHPSLNGSTSVSHPAPQIDMAMLDSHAQDRPPPSSDMLAGQLAAQLQSTDPEQLRQLAHALASTINGGGGLDLQGLSVQMLGGGQMQDTGMDEYDPDDAI